jgi:sulfatase modifying factor 1
VRARPAALAATLFAAVLAAAAPPLGAQAPPPGMALVPAGEFWMGRTRLWLIDEIGWQVRDRADDRPVHRVVLPAFFIDTHEVTNADYAAYVAAGGAAAPYHWGGPHPPADKARLPIYNVDWDEARTYCGSLGKRLPTEAEWERAARGGLEDLDFPWGNDYTSPGASEGAPPIKRAHGASARGPLPVGSFPANPFGLHDMSGNVWEWTADWYDLYYYSASPVPAPTGPADGLYRVVRGGSWADPESRHGSVYFRNFVSPSTRQPTIGVRCARSAP